MLEKALILWAQSLAGTLSLHILDVGWSTPMQPSRREMAPKVMLQESNALASSRELIEMR